MKVLSNLLRKKNLVDKSKGYDRIIIVEMNRNCLFGEEKKNEIKKKD